MPFLTLGSAATVVAGIFTGTISVGTAIVAVLLLAIAGYGATKWKLTEIAQDQTKSANDQTRIANEATAEWRENYKTERQRADDFEKRYHEQRALKHDLLTQLATEKLKTDQTIVLRALEVTQTALKDFHTEFVMREEEAARVRATVVATEERMIGQLAEIAAQLEHLRR